jgi:hypothetical protein
MSAPPRQPPLPGMKKAAAGTRSLPLWVSELPLIRPAMLCFALTLLASLLLLSLSASYRERQAQRLELARHTRAAAANLFNHVEAEKREIRSYEPQFLVLLRRGLIGEENRLAWIEAIRLSQERRKLLPISYDISAQQVLQVPLPIAIGQYQLRGSTMQLHMDLLHEMDLLNFFDDLRQAGYFAVQQCTLKRSGSGGNATAATLSADCSLLWLTLGSIAPAAQGRP